MGILCYVKVVMNMFYVAEIIEIYMFQCRFGDNVIIRIPDLLR